MTTQTSTITPPDSDVHAAALERLDALAKPLGALGVPARFVFKKERIAVEDGHVVVSASRTGLKACPYSGSYRSDNRP